MLLVVGSGGFVGRNVLEHFRCAGVAAIGASHSAAAGIYIDLSVDARYDEVVWREGISHALICSGITNIDRCFHEPAATEAFNVRRTSELIAALQARGIHIIYCSSDMVFRGDAGGYAEDAERAPSSAYGRQKKAVEDFLAAQNRPYSVIRMGKLYSLSPQKGSAVHALLDALKNGAPVRAASDQVIVPTLVEDVALSVMAIVQRGLSGKVHIAPSERFSRFGLATALRDAARLRCEIVECSIDDFSLAEPRAKNCWLDAGPASASTGVEPRNLREVIGEVVRSFIPVGDVNHAAV
jgi:dTDP-4-dehydrorhamnose reductase